MRHRTKINANEGGPRERPLILPAPMIRGLLDGSKTQNRWPVLPDHWELDGDESGMGWSPVACPYVKAGERLWIRETFRPIHLAHGKHEGMSQAGIEYQAGGIDWYGRDENPTMYEWIAGIYDAKGREADPDFDATTQTPWRPSIHMLRRCCRIVLDVVRVWTHPIRDITAEQIEAEGIRHYMRSLGPAGRGGLPPGAPILDYWVKLWDDQNAMKGAPTAWADNPYCYAAELRRIPPEEMVR